MRGIENQMVSRKKNLAILAQKINENAWNKNQMVSRKKNLDY